MEISSLTNDQIIDLIKFNPTDLTKLDISGLAKLREEVIDSLAIILIVELDLDPLSYRVRDLMYKLIINEESAILTELLKLLMDCENGFKLIDQFVVDLKKLNPSYIPQFNSLMYKANSYTDHLKMVKECNDSVEVANCSERRVRYSDMNKGIEKYNQKITDEINLNNYPAGIIEKFETAMSNDEEFQQAIIKDKSVYKDYFQAWVKFNKVDCYSDNFKEYRNNYLNDDGNYLADYKKVRNEYEEISLNDQQKVDASINYFNKHDSGFYDKFGKSSIDNCGFSDNYLNSFNKYKSGYDKYDSKVHGKLSSDKNEYDQFINRPKDTHSNNFNEFINHPNNCVIFKKSVKINNSQPKSFIDNLSIEDIQSFKFEPKKEEYFSNGKSSSYIDELDQDIELWVVFMNQLNDDDWQLLQELLDKRIKIEVGYNKVKLIYPIVEAALAMDNLMLVNLLGEYFWSKIKVESSFKDLPLTVRMREVMEIYG